MVKRWLLFFYVGFYGFHLNAQVPPARHLNKYYLIAHRGGIVDSAGIENSRPAMEAAVRRGYNMVEIDLRLTRDSIFIIQHAPDFKRFYGVDKPVSSMTWDEISKLRSSRGGSKVLSLEEVCRICQGRIQLMIDNKIRGNDTALFTRLITLLKKYGLLEHAMMIGTSASTPFFTGKIRLSCTRKQLEANMKKPGYSSADFYLFETPENLSVKDIEWAERNNILLVAIINKFRYYGKKDPFKAAGKDINTLKNEGVNYFQIDAEFDAPFFR